VYSGRHWSGEVLNEALRHCSIDGLAVNQRRIGYGSGKCWTGIIRSQDCPTPRAPTFQCILTPRQGQGQGRDKQRDAARRGWCRTRTRTELEKLRGANIFAVGTYVSEYLQSANVGLDRVDPFSPTGGLV
jgi:hypothetical protein